ncbi:MAG TPA: T9SS type A sorting domain-containing protein, partial [Bacteroidales bacterium]|nr:T9SS type A sorting domain-containing protein [Bacteroidales bacterium]
KIVNLPKNCVVTIYNISGTLIRQYTKDDSRTYIDWDLKNHAGIPIAGGVYLIHVKSPGLGEKIIKWFGTLRPVDLNAF